MQFASESVETDDRRAPRLHAGEIQEHTFHRAAVVCGDGARRHKTVSESENARAHSAARQQFIDVTRRSASRHTAGGAGRRGTLVQFGAMAQRVLSQREQR